MLPSILLLLLFFAAQLLALVLTIIFFMPEISVAPLDPAVLMNLPPVGFGVSLFFAELLLSVGIYIWYRRDRVKDVPVAVTEADSSRMMIQSCAGTLLLALGLSFLFAPFGLDDAGTQAMFEQQKNNVFCVALLCLVGPACEELPASRGCSSAAGFPPGALPLSPLSALLSSTATGSRDCPPSSSASSSACSFCAPATCVSAFPPTFSTTPSPCYFFVSPH